MGKNEGKKAHTDDGPINYWLIFIICEWKYLDRRESERAHIRASASIEEGRQEVPEVILAGDAIFVCV